MTAARLEQAAALLQTEAPELSRWLLACVDRLKHGTPADMALCLRGPGAVRERDRLIRQAGVLVGDASIWRTAGALAKALYRLDRRHGEKSRDDVSRLLEAAESAAPCPRTQRHLYSILIAEIGVADASAANEENHGITL